MTGKTILFCFALCGALLSCTKEVAGPKGEQGVQGPKGDAGPAGKDGNVSATANLVVESAAWTVSADSLEWSAQVNSPLITADVVDGGSVEVFVQHNNAWHSLPFFDHSSFLAFSFSVGTVKLIKADAHGEKPIKPGTATYKIVAVSAVE